MIDLIIVLSYGIARQAALSKRAVTLFRVILPV